MNENYIKLLAICSDSMGYIIDEQNTIDKTSVQKAMSRKPL